LFRKHKEEAEQDYKLEDSNNEMVGIKPKVELPATEHNIKNKGINDLIEKITEPYGDNVNDRVKLVRDVLNSILGED